MRKKYTKHQIFVVGFCLAIGITIISTTNFNLQPVNELAGNAINKDITELKAAKFFSQQPLRFIINEGQANENVKYHVQGAGHTVLFNEDKIVLRNIQTTTEKNEITLKFQGANGHPNIEGQKLLSGVAHFYKGSDPDGWQQNVKTYGSVLYQNLYHGIDMAYLGDDGILESEFYVSPGTDYHQIKFNYQGIKSKRINSEGALVLATNLGELIEKAPIAFQEIDGNINNVDVQFALLEDEYIGFEVGNYNKAYPLIIDPELAFLTTISSVTGVWFEDVAFDSNSDLVLAGAADRFFNANDVIDGSNHEGGLGNDGLLVKLDGTTGEVIYSALFGGSKTDYFTGIEIDQSDNVFLSGLTASDDFPVMNADQNASGGEHDAFFTKLNLDGELTYSTYLGGSARDWGEGIALDESGNVYIGGRTKSDDFPVLGSFQEQNNGGEWDIFVTKYSPVGSKLFSTYLGGTENDRFTGIAVTTSEMATISGVTESPDFPLKNAYQDTFGGGGFGEGDAFISRFNSAGNDLVYSTFLGGEMADWSYDIAVGNEGYTYITGGTASGDFPIVNGPSLPPTGDADGIVAMFDNNGQPMYSVRTNISGYDEFNAITADDSIAYPVGAWGDSIRIFEKSATDTLHAYFEFEAEGHQVNSVDLSGAGLAFAGAYFGTTRDVAESGQGSAGKAVLEQYHIYLIGDCLTIIIKPGAPNKLVLSADEDNGLVTVGQDTSNLLSTRIKAEDVKCVYVVGNKGGDSYIDLTRVTPLNYRNIPKTGTPIKIDNSNSASSYEDHKLYGCKEFGNEIIGGEGETDIIGGDNGNVLDCSRGTGEIFGGDGDDKITLGKIYKKWNSYLVYVGKGNDKITWKDPPDKTPNTIRNKSNENAMILNDSIGIDTLDFSALDSRITLDLSLLNSEQTLDDEGTKVILEGIFEVLIGTEYDDIITVSPLDEDDQHISGNGGNDILHFKAVISESVDDGSKISTPGYGDVYYSGIETVNMIIDDIDEFESPAKAILGQNYPNPFSKETTIYYILKETSSVVLKIYNISGQEIVTLVNDENQNTGKYEFTFKAGDLPNGVYYYSLKTNSQILSKRLIKK